MKLKANVGMLDVILRVGLGLVLVMLTALGGIGAWGWIGLVLIVTGASRWCPLYALVGVDTLKHTPHAHHHP